MTAERDKAVVAVAEALDERYDDWRPKDGLEDLMFVSGSNLMATPPALFSIAGVAVDALRSLGWTPPAEHKGDNGG